MRIGLQAWGSEGDIRPVIADPEELTRIGLRIAAASNPLLQGKIITDELFTPVSSQLYDAACDLCDRCDIVVGHFVVYQLHAAAEQRRRPCASVMFAPHLVPSRDTRPQGLPRLGAWGNVLGWTLARFALNRLMLSDVNRFRMRVGVTPVGDVMCDAWMSHQLNLIGVSPTLCPPRRDWPAFHRVCGFLALPATDRETVPVEVEAFLDGGPRAGTGTRWRPRECRTRRSSRTGPLSCITAAPGPRTRPWAPACRRLSCRTWPTSSSGPTSCAAPEWRPRRFRAEP